MGKSGSTEVQETSQQVAAADVARQQWSLYQNELKPYENLFMDKVDQLNDDTQYDNLAGDINLGYQQAFGQARRQATDTMTAAGVDPSSGKFQGTLGDLATDQASGVIDATNRAQTEQQNKYVAGLQDVQALGAGQKAEALQGYQSIAAASQQKAVSDAQSALEKSQSLKSLAGAVGGAAVRNYGLSSLTKPATQTTPASSGVFGSVSSNTGSGAMGLSTHFRNSIYQ